jgi:hypothetical protein
VPGRHFHFTFELTDASFVDTVASEVGSILRHAGLSATDAGEISRQALAAARSGNPGAPCRLQFDAGVDDVEVTVSCGGRTAWRAKRPIE